MAEIKKVGVLGAGLMGHAIAQVSATAGYDVVLREVDDDALGQGLGRIEKQLARAVEKGRSTQEDSDAIRGRVHGTVDYSDLADCDLVVEAITESLERKLEMWRAVDAVVKPEAVFATNTSSLSVVDQAAATSRPERFVGLHYFSPAQVMKLVEVIRAVTTADGPSTRRWPSRSPRGSSPSPRATAPASSSTACSSPTCSTRSAPTRRASDRSSRSTRR